MGEKKEAVTIYDALQKLSECKCSVRVQKYADSTRIDDCHKSLWKFLGCVDSCQRMTDSGKPLQVRDYPHDIWCCTISRRYGYGLSLLQSVEAALGLLDPPAEPELPLIG